MLDLYFISNKTGLLNILHSLPLNKEKKVHKLPLFLTPDSPEVCVLSFTLKDEGADIHLSRVFVKTFKKNKPGLLDDPFGTSCNDFASVKSEAGSQIDELAWTLNYCSFCHCKEKSIMSSIQSRRWGGGGRRTQSRHTSQTPSHITNTTALLPPHRTAGPESVHSK